MTWTGVPALDLFADAGLDDKTTHLLVESTDGHRVCIDVYATLDTVVAYARDGTSMGEKHDYEMRFIVPDVDRSWTAKGARAVETLALNPATDPESLEDIFKKPRSDDVRETEPTGPDGCADSGGHAEPTACAGRDGHRPRRR